VKYQVNNYDIDIINEATGSDIKDKEGNLYFAGRKRATSSATTASEDGQSRPFMIKFNPEKEVIK